MIDENSVIYISGPMTGIKYFNFPLFNKVEKMIIERFKVKRVINPAKNDQSLTYDQMMELDLHFVGESTHILILPGWHRSNGAKKEVKLALERGIEIIDLNDLFPVFEIR